MPGYRYSEQHEPPPATPVTDVAVSRYDDVYEVEPGLMTEHVQQQAFPNWDSLRIVASRHDHLSWMHQHFAESVVSGDEIVRSLDDD